MGLFLKGASSAGMRHRAGKALCLIRSEAVTRGIDFAASLAIEEATAPIGTVARVLKVRQALNATFDGCLRRRAGQVDRSGNYTETETLCRLELDDFGRGMRLFEAENAKPR